MLKRWCALLKARGWVSQPCSVYQTQLGRGQVSSIEDWELSWRNCRRKISFCSRPRNRRDCQRQEEKDLGAVAQFLCFMLAWVLCLEKRWKKTLGVAVSSFCAEEKGQSSSHMGNTSKWLAPKTSGKLRQQPDSVRWLLHWQKHFFASITASTLGLLLV